MKSHLIGKVPDAGKKLRAGGKEGFRGSDGWMASPGAMDMNLGKLQEMVREKGSPGMLQSMGSQRFRYNWVNEQHHNVIERDWGIMRAFSGREVLSKVMKEREVSYFTKSVLLTKRLVKTTFLFWFLFCFYSKVKILWYH